MSAIVLGHFVTLLGHYDAPGLSALKHLKVKVFLAFEAFAISRKRKGLEKGATLKTFRIGGLSGKYKIGSDKAIILGMG